MIRLAYEVGKYRKALADTVREGDTVLELGPHNGVSTRGYLEKAGKIVLVDKGRDCEDDLEKLAGENDNITFIREDARGFPGILKTLEHVESCHVFAIDLGGGRFPDTVFKVWATWSGVFKPRDTVIRNRGLIEFIEKAEITDTVDINVPDSGWLLEYGRATPYKLKKQLEEFSRYLDINEPLE